MQSEPLFLDTMYCADSGLVLAQFDAAYPDRAAGVFPMPNSAYQNESKGGQSLLTMRPSGDYYREDVWGFRIASPVVRSRKEFVLEVEFWDEGFGVIAARRLVDPAFNGHYAAPTRSVSYTRLNSRRLRVAAFQFNGPSEGSGDSDRADLELTGLQHLRAVRVLDAAPESYWTDLQSRIPSDVRPVVSLQRPMDVVCSAGVEVLGRFGPNDRRMLDRSIANLREQLPLAKALGFNGIEAYVRWDLVEPKPGEFDWTFYDAVVEELRRHDLKLFPLLIAGSAYALPEWFFNSDETVGFVCLEHGLSNPIQSIWSPYLKKHVTRFLRAFGRHYEPMGCLLGVRLGPSGNFGESQYPAEGDWGYAGGTMHLHIGMWAGDPYARADFRRHLREKYGTIEALNAAWGQTFASFDEVEVKLPEQCLSRRQRIDTYTWYTDSMTDWCEWWAIEARKALPNTPIYQSAGGWGAAEIGTDYSAQTKSMRKVNGGIRLTNELDSFYQAFYATRLAATAARLYDVPLGFEPAMGHTARGTAGRIFNCISNNGAHFFTYGGNIFNRQTSIDNWLKHYPLFDCREKPLVEVALLYPQTMNFLSHDAFRYLNAWGFNPMAREVRNRIEVDYLDDHLIRDGFLDRYKVLVFTWGNRIEKDVLDRIDAWLRAGGTVIFPCLLYTALATVEGDTEVFDRWVRGDVGSGRFFRYEGDDEPPSLYADFVASSLQQTPSLSPATRLALEIAHPDKVSISVQDSGHFLILNFSDSPAVIEHHAVGKMRIAPYGIERVMPRL